MDNNRRGSFQDLNAFFVFGALSILLIHILGFFIDAQGDFPWNYDIEALSIILLRFGRSFFIFGTGMLLFYWYKHRQVLWSTFWKKRLVNIIIPYLIWTGIYTYTQFHTVDLNILVPEYLKSLITGSSFYHLYYIPLYLQVTVFFMLTKHGIEKHLRFKHVIYIGILQLLLYGVYQYFFVSPAADQIDWSSSVILQILHNSYTYSQLYVCMYVFYFILGAYAGMYVTEWRTWIKRLLPYSWAVLILSTATLITLYLTKQMTYLEGLNIFNPLYMIYTTSFILAFYPLMAYLGRTERLGKLLSQLAKHNMAIYITHPFLLYLLESYVIYHVRFWPVPMIIFALLIVTAPLSVILYNCTTIVKWKKTQTQVQSKPVMQSYQA
ncbi:acyltransferase [Brevibacillus ginsengisoli]|uniref:acyltransferase n=1 Tax=Brevibacillus ginsengisoli TaxID=363854 RepID=UPI003CEB4227